MSSLSVLGPQKRIHCAGFNLIIVRVLNPDFQAWNLTLIRSHFELTIARLHHALDFTFAFAVLNGVAFIVLSFAFG
ncbi:hypothetical protein HC248_01703 [Polaromonas vacuolata]|uniref:Uncharacterized protein n=1 Tax=Polaromonas vacuolata TaxID=37448 RepID=A0A6H2H948_9BURK|nr:hypothetical protein HC248_01703 [Polaromonas vacuolata]